MTDNWRIKLRSVEFKVDHYCFEEGDYIDFRLPITLIVGDQGSGKSTLLSLLAGKTAGAGTREDVMDIDADPVPTIYLDFEKDNPRIQSRLRDESFASDLMSRFQSHGEVSREIIESLQGAEDMVVLVDEPDTALSPRSIHAMVKLFEEIVETKNCQIVAAVHNPLLIQSQPKVYSVEHREWLDPQFFLALHTKPAEENDHYLKASGTLAERRKKS